jgi:hypothetical protein
MPVWACRGAECHEGLAQLAYLRIGFPTLLAAGRA